MGDAVLQAGCPEHCPTRQWGRLVTGLLPVAIEAGTGGAGRGLPWLQEGRLCRAGCPGAEGLYSK